MCIPASFEYMGNLVMCVVHLGLDREGQFIVDEAVLASRFSAEHCINFPLVCDV